MLSFTLKIKIKKPADVVYLAFIDADNRVKWQTDMIGFTAVKGKYPELGSLSRIHFKNGKNPYLREEIVEHFEPGKKIVSSITGKDLAARVEITFEPDNWNTDLVFTWSGEGRNLVSKLSMKFSDKKIKLQNENDINKFKDLVEMYGVKFR